jgi:hypothetical protein
MGIISRLSRRWSLLQVAHVAAWWVGGKQECAVEEVMIQLGRWTTSSRLFAITIALLFFSATAQREFGSYSRRDVDFDVYYFTAAVLHDSHSEDIYRGALEGNPAARNVPEDSPIFKKARAAGPFGDVMMYLYPPLTADLLIPLTRLSPYAAAAVWRFVNLCLVVFSVVVLARLIGLRVASAQFFLLLVTAFCFFPIVEGIVVGQIVLVILALWTVSVAGYCRGSLVLSACALAFATTLKVTPLLAVPLFLLWNERKWLVAYFGTIAALLLAMGLFNGWHLMAVAAKVLSAMGAGMPILNNKGIIAVVDWMYYGRFFTGSDTIAAPPAVVAVLAKAISLAFYATCLVLVWLRGRKLDVRGRTIVFAVFALISALCSPIAWRHAYTVALVPLALLWVEALRRPEVTLRTVLLAVTSVATGTVALDIVAAVHMPWPLRILSGSIWTISSVALCLIVLGQRPAGDGVLDPESGLEPIDSRIQDDGSLWSLPPQQRR